MGKFFVPLIVFSSLVGFLAMGLTLDPRRVPSPLIDAVAPAFSLPSLQNPEQTVGSVDLQNDVSLLNVWASWCVACRQEHPLLMELAETGTVPIYGLNYKDERNDALDWLRRFGNPYTATATDTDGRVGIDWGVYGVPETFVVDHQGVIRYKHIGPLDVKSLQDDILPLVRKLKTGTPTQ